jgi:hypothetical protein
MLKQQHLFQTISLKLCSRLVNIVKIIRVWDLHKDGLFRKLSELGKA